MKIKILGSGASEGFPAIFCNCDSCIKARKAGGKNIRTRSQFYVDDDLIAGRKSYTFAARPCNRGWSQKLHICCSPMQPEGR